MGSDQFGRGEDRLFGEMLRNWIRRSGSGLIAAAAFGRVVLDLAIHNVGSASCMEPYGAHLGNASCT